MLNNNTTSLPYDFVVFNEIEFFLEHWTSSNGKNNLKNDIRLLPLAYFFTNTPRIQHGAQQPTLSFHDYFQT